jgi:hypothetical protein
VKIWDRIFGKPTTHMDDYLAHKRLEFERKRPAYQAHEERGGSKHQRSELFSRGYL